MEDILQTTILLAGIILFTFAAYSDVKSVRIPNKLVAAIALVAVTRLIVSVIRLSRSTQYLPALCFSLFVLSFLAGIYRRRRCQAGNRGGAVGRLP